MANLEKVAALAREATDLGVLTLRGFANLLAERIESAREEPDLPSTRPGDPDTVRVLSVHKAKGLEAPIVALYDTADKAWFSAGHHPPVGGGSDRHRLPRGLPARGVGRPSSAREAEGLGRRAGGCCTWPAPGPATSS